MKTLEMGHSMIDGFEGTKSCGYAKLSDRMKVK